ncbi:MAG: ABC transporter ATP-binding protein [Lachnospiraceae bacterium]
MLTIIKRIIKMAGKYRGKLLFSFVMSFMESSMASISIFLVYVSFEWINKNQLDMAKIVRVLVALATALVLRYVFKLLEYIYQSGVGYEMICDARLDLGKKLLRLPMGFYHDTDAGNISSVINNDMVFAEGMAMSFVAKIVGSYISAVIMTLFLVIIDWRIAAIAVCVYPTAWAANNGLQQFWTKYSARRQEAHGETAAIMLEYLQGVYVIKAFGGAGRQGERFRKVLDKLEIVSYDFEMKALPYMCGYLIPFHIGTALILCGITWLLLGKAMTFSIRMLLVVIVFAVYAPMEAAGVSSGFIRLMNACLDRMQAIMDYPVLDDDGQEQKPESFDVEFEDVSFAYSESPVLQHISFTAPEHTMTAIVGPSGSGKSTLLNLTARFWDVKDGAVKIGGIDVRCMKCETVMDQITAVYQKAYMFQDTIYNNILLGKQNASREQVMEAAKKARCHEFIMKLEEGYETIVGEGGVTLSGGERQRISIARALLKDAPIILLDEVTANIDPENERYVQEAINQLICNKTVFVVAHKLSAIQNAHQIVVLGKNGNVEEIGTHEELYEKQGAYRMMWEKSQRIRGYCF